MSRFSYTGATAFLEATARWMQMIRNILLVGLLASTVVVAGCALMHQARVERDVSQVSGLIVRFKSPDAKRLSRENQPPPQALIDEVVKLSKTPLVFRRTMSLESFVFYFSVPMSWEDAQVIVNRVKQSPGIESVEPDIQHTHQQDH